jgi:4a-hydroxytetrahydrobiopterin dehydratase
MTLLSDAQIEQRLAGLDWRRDGEAIVRDYELADFAAAVELVERVARRAEEANHHPDILLHGWNKVRLTLSTHSEGGITEADFALAERIDAPAEPAFGG